MSIPCYQSGKNVFSDYSDCTFGLAIDKQESFVPYFPCSGLKMVKGGSKLIEVISKVMASGFEIDLCEDHLR